MTCTCAGCGREFTSLSAFDQHRSRDYTAPDLCHGDPMLPDDQFDAVILAALSMMAGLFWPLALPIALVMWHPRKTPAELREQIGTRDQRIAELERELGIGKS